jgi:hypothetical protein
MSQKDDEAPKEAEGAEEKPRRKPKKAEADADEEKELPVRFFKLRIGKFPFGGVDYQAGQVISTTRDLAAENPGKFKEVDGPARRGR